MVHVLMRLWGAEVACNTDFHIKAIVCYLQANRTSYQCKSVVNLLVSQWRSLLLSTEYMLGGGGPLDTLWSCEGIVAEQSQ